MGESFQAIPELRQTFHSEGWSVFPGCTDFYAPKGTLGGI